MNIKVLDTPYRLGLCTIVSFSPILFPILTLIGIVWVIYLGMNSLADKLVLFLKERLK